MVVDPSTDLMHCAYIHGKDRAAPLEGYAILDVSNPRRPVEVGRFDYAGRPDYTKDRFQNGEPRFENCHYANYDPRGLAIVGDETASGVPGGKHIFDIGWRDGSPQDPQHIRFTYSPHAELMDEENEAYDWTGHNFDVISSDQSPTNQTLLVSGDYHEGTVLYDISDPTAPEAVDWYKTADRKEQAAKTVFELGSPPMAWDGDYNSQKGIAVTSDMVTGIYAFDITTS